MLRESTTAEQIRQRSLIIGGLVVLFMVGYFGLGRSADPARAIELATPLDAAIPFLPQSVWVYLSVFPAAFLPIFLVRSLRLIRHAALCYGAAMLISFAIFALLPVSSARLRVPSAELNQQNFSQAAVALLYRLDPPFNLFPSMHLSIALLAALTVRRASRRYGAMALAMVAAIAVSIATVKQHFIADGLAGLALAWAIDRAVHRRLGIDPNEPRPAFGMAGLIAYACLQLAALGACYCYFLSTL